MDTYPITSVQPLRSAGVVLSVGWKGTRCEADILAARKGDGRILDLLQQACASALSTPQQQYTNRSVLLTTGPIRWSRWATGHHLTGRPIVNRFAEMATAADADDVRDGRYPDSLRRTTAAYRRPCAFWEHSRGPAPTPPSSPSSSPPSSSSLLSFGRCRRHRRFR